MEPTSGRIFLGGRELTGLGPRDLRARRRRIGMIFQEYALVERLSVMENVPSGRLGYVGFWASFTRRFPPEDIQRAYRLPDRVGLMSHADKRADALSGGKRQRVGIARALSFATIGFIAKLLAEGIDEAQAEAIRATGASWLQLNNYAIQRR